MPIHVSTGDRIRDKMILAILARFSLPSGMHLTVCDENYFSSSDLSTDLPNGTNQDVVFVICSVSGFEDDITRLSERFGDRLKLLTEPFDIEDFSSQLRKITHSAQAVHNTDSELSLDSKNRTVSRGELSVTLSAKEWELFTLLIDNPGRTISKNIIYDKIWPDSRDTNTADVFICYLRRKLSPILGKGAIICLRGQGYMLKL